MVRPGFLETFFFKKKIRMVRGVRHRQPMSESEAESALEKVLLESGERDR